MYERTHPESEHRFDDHPPQRTVVGAAVTAAVPPAVVAAMTAPAVTAVVTAAVVVATVAVAVVRRDPGEGPDETDPPAPERPRSATRDHGVPADD